jgi:hypothetical protein
MLSINYTQQYKLGKLLIVFISMLNFNYTQQYKLGKLLMVFTLSSKIRRGRDRKVCEFTTTYAISPYHHEMCELEYRSWRGVLYALFGDNSYMIYIIRNPIL